MNKQIAVSLLIHFYAWLLRLYPPSFHEEFGEEMTAVFIEALSNVQQQGRLALLTWCRRELIGLFAEIVREQWLSFRPVMFSVHLQLWKEVRMQINRTLVVMGGLILILGSRLPWMSVPVLFGFEGPAFEAIEIGWEGDGFITGSIGLILLLVGIFWRGRIEKRFSITGAILAALAVLVVCGDFYRILEIDPDAGFFAATDVGIYVTLIGAFLALAGSLYRTPMDQEKHDTPLPSSSL